VNFPAKDVFTVGKTYSA